MFLRWIGIAAAVVVFAVVAMGAGWFFFVRENAELATNAPEIPQDLVQTQAAATATAEPTGEATVTVTPIANETAAPTSDTASGGTLAFSILAGRSQASYFADEQLASLSVPSTVQGITTIAGTPHLTEDLVGLAPGEESSFTVDLTGLQTDDDRRDNRVQQILETSQYPEATFVATSFTGFDPSIADAEEQTLQLTGILTVHSVSKEVTWEVKARRQDDVITALGTLTVRYTDFGIETPSSMAVLSLEDDLTLQVEIVARAS